MRTLNARANPIGKSVRSRKSDSSSNCIASAILETLEQRQLFSVFYNYEIVGQSGTGGLTGMGTGPTINDAGTVAYIGKHAVGDAIIVKPQGGNSKNISPGADNSSGRTFSQTLQINNTGKVVGQARVVGGTLKSFIQIYDSNSTDSFTTAATADSGGTGQYQAVFPFPTINNSGATAYGAFTKDLKRVLATNGKTSGMLGVLSPMIADTGNIIVKAGNLANSAISLFSSSLSLVKSFADATFTTTGAAPGISDDGKVIAFAAIGAKGPGIYVSFLNGTTWSVPLLVAGGNKTTTNPELGFDDAGGNVYFKEFSLDSRVAVIHKDLGPTGLVGDLVEVSFIGTPSAKSITNSKTSTPLLFSASQGLWTQRIEMDAQIGGSKLFVPHPASAIPVVQIGDKILGQTITGLSVSDQLALATTTDTGAARTVRPGDHRVVFYATTSAGSVVMRAGHLDSDEDGLLDSWETSGVDINNDGTSDLNLKAMGADPLKRDLFVEIDWTNPRTSGGLETYSNELPRGTIHQLDLMYAAAPALADGVAAGIKLHIDAGAGKDQGNVPFSLNMGTAALQGGSLITMPNGTTHPDLIYMNTQNYVNTPGVNAMSFGDVKKKYFGADSKGARELVFHYNVLADFYDTIRKNNVSLTGSVLTGGSALTNPSQIEISGSLPNSSGAVLITSGKGAGQIRSFSSSSLLINNTTHKYIIVVNNSFAVTPDATSKYALLDGSSGNSEVGFYPTPDHNSVPGNDTIVTFGTFTRGMGTTKILSNSFYTYETIAHEVGHTLGLRHGGNDQNANKPAATYKSIMSYTHQLTVGDTVRSYSDAADTTFNDWANLKMNFQDTFTHLGNTFAKGPTGTGNITATSPEISVADLVKLHNQTIDFDGPAVTFTSPIANANVKLNSAPVVKLKVTDPSGINSVSVMIDLNGNGKNTDAGEIIKAVVSAGGVFTATFIGKFTGALGNRTITVLADDLLGNFSSTTQIVKLIA